MTGETLAFTKGHGTENDFLLLFDEHGKLDLSPGLVRALCDRRAGIGADGVLRAVRSGDLPDGQGFDPDVWFMDYRNADGSLAEMCGNGARVFAAYLEREAGVDFGEGREIGTRAGGRQVTAIGGGRYSVGMGRWTLSGGGTADAEVTPRDYPSALPAVRVDVGNPHTVAAISSLAELSALDLSRPPVVEPEPPNGTNVEFVVPLDPLGGPRGRIQMRVYERGVGETRSCGTGACAAAIASMAWEGDGAPHEWDVEVPGGELTVRLRGSEATLEGPAVLVGDGLVDLLALTLA